MLVRNFLTKIIMAAMVLGLASVSFAQPYDPCSIPPGYYRTQTQGGWGQDECQGNNVACWLNDNFATVFPTGLTVGGNFTMHFSSSAAIAAYLPAGGPSGSLTTDHVDPVTTEAGNFAGQVTALALSLGFSDAGIDGYGLLGDLVIPFGVNHPAGSFAGWTVRELFDLANEVLGGDLSNIPADVSFDDLHDAVTAINENFVDGTHSEGYIVDPDCDEILAVELADFTAVAGDNRVDLTWQTAAESDNNRFEIVRNGATVGEVRATNNAGGARYTWTDTRVENGTTYTYTLVAVDVNGAREELSTTEATPSGRFAVASDFALYQNYPNPFNPSTEIAFDLVEQSRVTLSVYDITGRLVATLANGQMSAGRHNVSFDGSSLSAGVYFYKLEAGTNTAVRKLMLVK